MPIACTDFKSKIASCVALFPGSAKAVVFILLSFGFAGCSQYRVSINDNPVKPVPLFHGYRIPDLALHRCIEEAIMDQNIQHASGLTLLNCASRDVSSLEGIDAFTQLGYLNLDNNRVFSLAPLFQIEALTSLSIKSNPSVSCKDLSLLRARGVKIQSKDCT